MWGVKDFVERKKILAPQPNFWYPNPNWHMGGAPEVQVGRQRFRWGAFLLSLTNNEKTESQITFNEGVAQTNFLVGCYIVKGA